MIFCPISPLPLATTRGVPGCSYCSATASVLFFGGAFMTRGPGSGRTRPARAAAAACRRAPARRPARARPGAAPRRAVPHCRAACAEVSGRSAHSVTAARVPVSAICACTGPIGSRSSEKRARHAGLTPSAGARWPSRAISNWATVEPCGVANGTSNSQRGPVGSMRMLRPAPHRQVRRARRQMVGQRRGLQQGLARDRRIGLAQQHLADVARRHVGGDRRRGRRLRGGRRAAIGRRRCRRRRARPCIGRTVLRGGGGRRGRLRQRREGGAGELRQGGGPRQRAGRRGDRRIGGEPGLEHVAQHDQGRLDVVGRRRECAARRGGRRGIVRGRREMRLEKQPGAAERLLEAVGRDRLVERRLQGEQPFGGLPHRLRQRRHAGGDLGIGQQRRKPALARRRALHRHRDRGLRRDDRIGRLRLRRQRQIGRGRRHRDGRRVVRIAAGDAAPVVSGCAATPALSPAIAGAAPCGAAGATGLDELGAPPAFGAGGSSVRRMPSGVFFTASRTVVPGVSGTCVCTSMIDLPIASLAMLWPSSSSTFASMMSPALSAGTAALCCGLSATVVGETIRSTVAVLAGGGRHARLHRSA